MPGKGLCLLWFDLLALGRANLGLKDIDKAARSGIENAHEHAGGLAEEAKPQDNDLFLNESDEVWPQSNDLPDDLITKVNILYYTDAREALLKAIVE